MSAPHENLRSLLPSVHADAAFADAVVWVQGEKALVGAGGWTVLLRGKDRLRRISELWSRSVKATPQTGTLAMLPVPAADADEPRPQPAQRAWVAGTFTDASDEPAVLRIPTHWTEQSPQGVKLFVQDVSATALRAAVAVDEAAELAPHGHMPLPAADPQRAWDDSGYADGVRAVLERLGRPSEGPEATERIPGSRTAHTLAAWCRRGCRKPPGSLPAFMPTTRCAGRSTSSPTRDSIASQIGW